MNSSKISRGKLSFRSEFIDSPFKTLHVSFGESCPRPLSFGYQTGSTSVGPPGLPSPNPLLPGQKLKLQKESYTTTDCSPSKQFGQNFLKDEETLFGSERPVNSN